MASTFRTVADIASMALRNLGEDAIDLDQVTTPTQRRAKIVMEFWETVRDATLHDHPWGFATKRATLYAYTTPSTTITPGATTGTGISFTAGAAGTFALTDVNRQIWNTTTDGTGKATITALPYTTPAASLLPAAVEGTGITFTASAAVFVDPDDVGKIIYNIDGDGEATITAVTDTTHVVATITEPFPDLNGLASGDWRLYSTDVATATVTEDFPSTDPIASGSWRLYYPIPEWGYAYSIVYPSDALRIWRLDDPSIEYRSEGGYIVTDETSLDVLYIRQETDVRKYSHPFVQALVAHLTAILAKPITGQGGMADMWMKIYGARLGMAKAMSGMEGTPEELETNILTDVRR